MLPEAADTWFVNALGGSVIALVPVTPAISQRAVKLREHPRYPHEQLIIASALVHDARQLLSARDTFAMHEELKGRMG